MAYIGQGIKQGTFKVLDTSGNTYNGSNTTFNLGTQVRSAAQLLVSHDGVIQKAGTDYTLATGGTQITFSTAPASGASIFIVEISGAVGGTVTPSDNSVGVTQLNLSDGTNGQALTTNGSGTISFSTISTSLTGIDDQSSSNDDQLTITDTAVVINEDSDDVDFRVESNGNANMLFVSGGNDVVGIGNEGDLGDGLHIKKADSGASALADAHALVIESDADTGLSILQHTGGNGTIAFGDQDDNNIGMIQYYHGSTNNMVFFANAAERMRIHNAGGVSIGSDSLVDPANVQIGAIALQPGGLSCLMRANNAALALQRSGNNGRVLQFYKGTTERGYIEVDASSTAYNTSSDYRLKENIVDLNDGITRLKELKPRRFNFIGESDTRDGFVAHEVTAVPEAISGTKDETETKEKLILDKDNNILASDTEEADWIKGKEDDTYPSDSTWVASKVYPVHQGIDQAKLVPLLTAALQEAVTKIEALEARVTTLEG